MHFCYDVLFRFRVHGGEHRRSIVETHFRLSFWQNKFLEIATLIAGCFAYRWE